jgi:hypothetical protein
MPLPLSTEAQTRTFNNGGTMLYGRLAPIATQEMSDFEYNLIDVTWGAWTIAWSGDYANDGVLYAGASAAIGAPSWVA